MEIPAYLSGGRGPAADTVEEVRLWRAHVAARGTAREQEAGKRRGGGGKGGSGGSGGDAAEEAGERGWRSKGELKGELVRSTFTLAGSLVEICDYDTGPKQGV